MQHSGQTKAAACLIDDPTLNQRDYTKVTHKVQHGATSPYGLQPNMQTTPGITAKNG